MSFLFFLKGPFLKVWGVPKKLIKGCQVYNHMVVIPAFRRLRREEDEGNSRLAWAIQGHSVSKKQNWRYNFSNKVSA